MNEGQWFGVALLAYIVIMATLVLFFKITNQTYELRREIDAVQHEVGAVQREVQAVQRESEYRAEADQRNVDRLLSEIRRSR